MNDILEWYGSRRFEDITLVSCDGLKLLPMLRQGTALLR